MRVEQVDQVGHPYAQVIHRLGQDFPRFHVSLAGGLGHQFRRDAFRCAFRQVGYQRRYATGHALAGLARDGCARSQRLQTAPVPTAATRPIRHDGDVADLTRHSAGPVIQFSVEDQSTTDAGADRDVDHVLRASPGTEAKLAQRRRVSVILQKSRDSQFILNQSLERHALPAGQVGWGHHHARLDIEGAWCADAHRRHLCLSHSRLCHHLAGTAQHTFDDRLLTRCRVGLPVVVSDDCASAVCQSGADLGAAQINADDGVLGNQVVLHTAVAGCCSFSAQDSIGPSLCQAAALNLWPR